MSSEVPEQWPMVRLSQIAHLSLGKMLDKNKNRGDMRPYLANINVRWGGFDLKELRQMRFEDREIERYSLKRGDIVMCEGGEPGRCALWLEDDSGMMIQKALHRIRPLDGIDSHYLYFALAQKVSSGSFAEYLTGGGIQHLPGEKLADVEVPTPPLDEQRRIAQVLWSIDKCIEVGSAEIQQLQAVRSGVEAKALGDAGGATLPEGRTNDGWARVRLRDVFKERRQRGLPGLPVASVGIETGLTLRSSSNRRVDSSLEEDGHALVKKNDIAYNMMRMWQGACGLADTDCIVSPAYVVMTPSNAIDPKFAFLMLRSPRVIRLLHAYSQGIVDDRLRLYPDAFGQIPINLPPLPYQQAVVEELSAIDLCLEVAKRSQTRLAAVKAEVLRDLLTGRVRVPA